MAGEAVITFDTNNRLRLTALPSVLMATAPHVNGFHIEKYQRFARTSKDEMTCYYMMKHSGAKPDEEVLAWLYECKEHRNKLANIIASEDPVQLGSGYHSWLYNFQAHDVQFMVEAKRCINGNEPGIGKTLEAIAACDEVKAERILVICQKTLMYYWADQFKERSYGDIVVVEESSSYKKHEKLREKMLREARIKVVSYSLLDDKKWPEIMEAQWDVIIADEAHYLKNPDALRSKAASKLQTKYCWLLTGTPDPNGDVGEIFGLLHVLEPERFGSYWDFCYRYGTVEEKDVYLGSGRKVKNKKARGVRPDAKDVFHRLIAPYMFMRKKADVYKDLPEKIYQKIPVELSGKQRKLYDALYKEMVAEIREHEWLVTKNAVDLNTKLRQLTLSPALVGGVSEMSPKIETILDIVSTTPGQVVVFTWYRAFVTELAKFLNDADISCVTISGNLAAGEVHSRVLEFQAGKAKVVLGTITKMSEGNNFQNASTLIFADKSYVPKDNKQAEDRVHRPGQKERPRIISLVAKDTLDEAVEEILIDKQESIQEIESFQYMIDMLRSSNL